MNSISFNSRNGSGLVKNVFRMNQTEIHSPMHKPDALDIDSLNRDL